LTVYAPGSHPPIVSTISDEILCLFCDISPEVIPLAVPPTHLESYLPVNIFQIPASGFTVNVTFVILPFASLSVVVLKMFSLGGLVFGRQSFPLILIFGPPLG